MKTHIILLLIICAIAGCKTEKKPQPIDKDTVADDTIVTPKSVENTNDLTKTEEEEEEEEYFEDEMKFMPPIENDSYFGVAVGSKISDNPNTLRPGELRTGEGAFNVHYMIHKVDTLGYVYGDDIIESIHIWDSRGSTNNGIRVGTTFAELKNILQEPKVHGSEMEARVHVFNENHMYRLNYHSMEYNLDFSEIPDSVVVKEIIIVK